MESLPSNFAVFLIQTSLPVHCKVQILVFLVLYPPQGTHIYLYILGVLPFFFFQFAPLKTLVPRFTTRRMTPVFNFSFYHQVATVAFLTTRWGSLPSQPPVVVFLEFSFSSSGCLWTHYTRVPRVLARSSHNS